MPEIQPLEPVNLREAWPHEAHDFTPWLSRNIDQLAEKLNMKLEEVETEVMLHRGGKVDLRARQAGSDAVVVIENQLGGSDDDHCLRLLGYAAGAEASILVWVARDFTAYHKGILEWLNEADTIDVYAVEVRAFRVGGTLAFDFDTVVEPSVSRKRPSSRARENSNTRYAEFYRPLVAKLRQSKLLPMGKGGFRGRYRSFQTGYEGSIYAASWPEENPRVYLGLFGTSLKERFHALRRRRDEIDQRLSGSVWKEESDWAGVMLEYGDTVSWTASEEEVEKVRQWMADNLLQLRDAIQPHLDAADASKGAAPDKAGATD